MPRISILTAVIAVVFSILLQSAPAVAQSEEDAQAIRSTIQSQLSAMQQDRWDDAFTYASPTIQAIFRDPENFSRMVVGGYPMVYRPKTFKAGDLTPGPHGPVQVMFFEDQEGRLFIADYLMQMIDGEWRINGVSIRPAPEQTA